jgi:hypothetical protein
VEKKHVWMELKHRKYPNICNTSDGPGKVKQRLAEVLMKLMYVTLQGFFEKPRKSMPDRVASAVVVKG